MKFQRLLDFFSDYSNSVETIDLKMGDMLGFDGNNTVFINNLIFEFKEWIKNND